MKEETRCLDCKANCSQAGKYNACMVGSNRCMSFVSEERSKYTHKGLTKELIESLVKSLLATPPRQFYYPVTAEPTIYSWWNSGEQKVEQKTVHPVTYKVLKNRYPVNPALPKEDPERSLAWLEASSQHGFELAQYIRRVEKVVERDILDPFYKGWA